LRAAPHQDDRIADVQIERVRDVGERTRRGDEPSALDRSELVVGRELVDRLRLELGGLPSADDGRREVHDGERHRLPPHEVPPLHQDTSVRYAKLQLLGYGVWWADLGKR